MMNQIDEMISPEEINVDSFEVKDSLHPRFWNDEQHLDMHIRRALLVIAKDFIDEYNLGEYVIDDIIMTGSLANYNWSEEFSDIDLHIIMDTTQLSEDPSLAKSISDAMRNVWNKTHTDISVGGFPVELYIQDTHEPHKSSGVYSLLDDEWKTSPSLDKLSGEIEEDEIKTRVAEYMNLIDKIEMMYNDIDPLQMYHCCAKLMDKIKAERASGLTNDDAAELTTGNLIFKSLRRSGHIEKLIDIKRRCFDRARSIK